MRAYSVKEIDSCNVEVTYYIIDRHGDELMEPVVCLYVGRMYGDLIREIIVGRAVKGYVCCRMNDNYSPRPTGFSLKKTLEAELKFWRYDNKKRIKQVMETS